MGFLCGKRGRLTQSGRETPFRDVAPLVEPYEATKDIEIILDKLINYYIFDEY